LLKLPELLTEWEPRPISPTLALILTINLALLVWRLGLRFGFVTYAYGWRQGLLSIPRVLVGNWIAMLAAWTAVARYRRTRRSGRATWDKTEHMFPAEVPAE